MNKNPRILIAIDGSERSFAASVYLGKVLSKKAEVVLYHVMAEVPEAFKDVNANLSNEADKYPLNVWKANQQALIDEFMTVACDILTASGFPNEFISVKTRPLKSGVARDILNESHRNYDLLVAGRTGINKIEEIALGSVASKLVEGAANLPVVIGGESTQSKKIIIAIDGSTGSMRAVSRASELLDPAESEILLCYVIRQLKVHQMGGQELFLPQHEADWISANQKKIIPAMEEAKKRLQRSGFTEGQITSEILTNQKSRAAAIVNAATRGGYDTIVVGRRGLTSVGEFKVGRVTRKILQFAYRNTLWIVN